MDPWARAAVSDMGQLFRRGLERWHSHDLRGALDCFRQLDQRADREDAYGNLYTSYHGVALVYTGDISGLNLCRQAASVERFQPDVFCNLALAEHKLNHRRRAYQAMMRGLKLDPRHPGLQQLRSQMGVRRRPALPFLARNNLVNRMLGRMTYRRRGPGR
jgi:hypothetical protein